MGEAFVAPPGVESSFESVDDAELDQTYQKELFPPANAIEKIRASLETINIVLNGMREESDANNGQKIATFLLFQNLLVRVGDDQKMSSDSDIAQKIVNLTVALLDLLIVDEMSSETGMNAPSASQSKESYYRENGTRQGELAESWSLGFPDARFVYGLPGEILAAIKQMPTDDEDVAWISDVSGLANISNPDHVKLICLRENLNLEDARALCTQAVKLYPKACIMIPIKIDENCEGVVFVNSLSGHFGFNIGKESFLPFSELPRQEIWQSLLNKGQVPFVQKDFDTDLATEVEPTMQNSVGLREEVESFWRELELDLPGRWHHYQQRKAAVWLHVESEQIGKFYDRHTEHYKQVMFSREHREFGEPFVAVTRSGVSATETAMKTIAQATGDSPKNRPHVYCLESFYYENYRNLENLFGMTSDPNQARIILINDEPSDPFGTLRYPNEYLARRNRLIKDMIGRAQADPTNSYYLIYDKTVDLLAETFSNEDNLPANLTIIETASITKHQRGGQNYFYGVVGSWGTPEFNNSLQNEIPNSRGGLSALGIIHLPRLSRTEITRSREDFIQKNQVIADSLEKVQDEWSIPRGLRWRAQTQTYFTFFLPPTSGLLHLFARINGTTFASEQKNLLDDPIQFEKHLGFNPTLETAFDNYEFDGDFEYGDSFGLDATRVTNFFPADESNPTDPILNRFGTTRISPGRLTTEEDLEKIVCNIMEVILPTLKRLIEEAEDNE